MGAVQLCLLLFPLLLFPLNDSFCTKVNRNRYISSLVSNHVVSSTSITSTGNGCPITAIKYKFASIKSFVTKKKFKTASLVFIVLLGSILLPGKFRRVNAAIMSNIKVKGWDLYGRIPHDDWIFNMWTLTNPNLLKRSFAEVILHELPDVIINMKERRRLNELVTILSGFGYFAVAVMLVTVLYRSAIQTYQRRVEREDSIRGYKLPTSAISKKAKKKGRQLDGMDEGWVDMELNVDDSENNDKNNDDDDDDDSDDSKKSRKTKK